MLGTSLWVSEVGGSFSDKLREVGTQLGVLTNAFRQLEAAYECETQPTRSRPIWQWGAADSTDAAKGPLMKLWYDSISPATPGEDSVVSRASTPSAIPGIERPERERQEKPSAFLNALVKERSTDNVTELLRQRADPNEQFSRFSCIGKDFSTGTPLCIAALRNDKSLVRTLVAYAADPLTSDYSFVAGAEQMLWSGPAVHACLPYGYLDILELLVGAKANIHAQGSNGANLVWQAAYFGHVDVLEHCLRENVEFATAAVSQDDRALHVGALTGHTGVVKALLAANARHDVEDGRGHSPLDDAVAQGHADVSKYLVAYNADIFRVSPFADMPVTNNSSGMAIFQRWQGFSGSSAALSGGEMRCIDQVFLSENPLLLSAVAQGLSHARDLLNNISTDDFIRFLRASGHTPVHILQAIFQPHTLRYWEDQGGRRYRRTKTAAFLDARRGVNIAEGPHFRVLQHCFNYKRPLPKYALDFLETLLPSNNVVGHQMMYVPVTAYMSHIPWLHKDLKVLLAIADCETSQIFNNAGCQAIISVLWAENAVLARFRMLMAFFEVLNLVFINITLNFNKDDSPERGLVFMASSISAAVVWAVSVFFEVAQAIGYVSSSLTKRYLATPRYWFDLVVLGMTFATIIGIWQLGLDAADSALFNTILGTLVFLKWMGFLIYLRQIRSVGVRILPITTTMFDVGPFCLVLCVYLIGSVNMYYALGVQSFQESAITIWRLVVLGDLDLNELEGVFPSEFTLLDDGTIRQDESARTKYYWAVRVIVVTVSFIVGVLMMNLFVAILCLSYSRAAEKAWLSLMRSRANIVLDQHAIRVGMEIVFCPRRAIKKRRSNSHGVGRKTSTLSIENTTSGNLADQLEEARSAYIWFARPGDVEK